MTSHLPDKLFAGITETPWDSFHPLSSYLGDDLSKGTHAPHTVFRFGCWRTSPVLPLTWVCSLVWVYHPPCLSFEGNSDLERQGRSVAHAGHTALSTLQSIFQDFDCASLTLCPTLGWHCPVKQLTPSPFFFLTSIHIKLDFTFFTTHIYKHSTSSFLNRWQITVQANSKISMGGVCWKTVMRGLWKCYCTHTYFTCTSLNIWVCFYLVHGEGHR